MRILLVEDNPKLGAGLKKLLDEVYAVDHVLTGEDGIAAAHSQQYDLIILDLSLPDMDGLTVLRDVRGARLTTPVLILTARDDLNDRIAGLDLGADDYMTKPFELSELEARVRALLRRVSMEKTSLLQFGPVEFDLRTNSATAGNAPVDLSARETMVLRALMMANGRLLSKAQLLDSITRDDIDSPLDQIFFQNVGHFHIEWAQDLWHHLHQRNFDVSVSQLLYHFQSNKACTSDHSMHLLIAGQSFLDLVVTGLSYSTSKQTNKQIDGRSHIPNRQAS